MSDHLAEIYETEGLSRVLSAVTIVSGPTAKRLSLEDERWIDLASDLNLLGQRLASWGWRLATEADFAARDA